MTQFERLEAIQTPIAAVLSTRADTLGNPFRLSLTVVPGHRRRVADCATDDRRNGDLPVDHDRHRAADVS